MPSLTPYFSTALHICKHSMALITLKADADDVRIEHQLQTALSEPWLTDENRDRLLSFSRSLSKQSPLLVSLSPDLLNLKFIALPTELARKEQKKYIRQQLSLTNDTLNYRETLSSSTLFTVTLQKQKIKTLVTFLKKCRLTPRAIHTTPLIIPKLLPQTKETHLFISQHKMHYSIGCVFQNTLQNYFELESQENESILAAIAAQYDLTALKHIWLGTESSATALFFLLIEKKFKLFAKSLFDIPFSEKTTALSAELGNAALLAYWGLNGKH